MQINIRHIYLKLYAVAHMSVHTYIIQTYLKLYAVVKQKMHDVLKSLKHEHQVFSFLQFL